MNNPYSRKEGKIDNKNKNLYKSDDVIDLDADEQAMNGLYGMPETELEDSDHHEKETSKK
ncbi:DUF4021 domain-containing protein [Bacillus sp. DX1.1]|uniref:DUF4021 domain-containing protein n=1 Tax=unclassified Bacillus (in: firmicutes) TaxID=185979 RepID=UPI002570DF37|nr:MULTISPECIES: DUF4021 domain-containing protein [unclassified Bacillus (in: firmicutes)]MDM5155090.1 DUF4021 domain-containing protein [Bacillus sp. DX1.1]WJE83947.1 DUF4021 domain-containing protein [Bacillus sp. DX3.1]